MNELRYNRIVRHLDLYGNTIIVPKDLHKITIDKMVKRLESDVFKIEELYEKNETNKTMCGDDYAHVRHYWIIRAWRQH